MDERPLRLLLVEDNPADARLLQALLEETPLAARCQWTVAARLSEALAHLAAEPYAAVLLDLSLPDSQGLDTLAQVRAAADRTPIIVVTGLSDEAAALKAIQAGAQDYLVKGQITGDLLARTLRYAISREQAELALRDSQARLAGMIEMAMDAVITIDAGERIVLFNRAAEKIFGYPAADMLGQPLSRLLPAALRAGHHAYVQAFGASGLTNRTIGAVTDVRLLTGLRADGGEFPIEAAISQIAVAGQKLYTVILRDVTERERVQQALAASEAELRALFAAMTDVILVLDAQGTYLEIAPTNPPAAYRPAPELIGRRLHDLFPMDEADGFVAAIGQVLATGQPSVVEYHLDAGGQPVWFEATVSLMGAGRVFMMARDISARKRNEQALRESETHLRSLFESMPISIWEEDFSAVKDYLDQLPGAPEDLDGYLSAHPEALADCVARVKVLDVNAATVALLEAPDKASLLGGLVAALTPESAAVFQQELAAITRGQTRLRADAVVNTRMGRRREVTLDWAVVLGHEQRYSRVLLSLVDITERKQAEEAQRQSEARYRLLFERNPMPMWLHDPETLRFLDVNAAALGHYGFTQEEFLAMSVPDISVPEEIARLRALAQAPEAGQDRSGNWRHHKKDGTLIDVEIVSHQIELAGRATRLVLSSDVTERRRAEARVQRQLERLAALRAIDVAISASLDLRLTLQLVLEQVAAQLQVDAADVLLLNSGTHALHFAAGRGFRSGTKIPTNMRLGQSLAGQVALERKRLLAPDLAQTRASAEHAALIAAEGFQAYGGVPLIAKGQVAGVLEVYQRTPLEPDEEWLDFLEALAGQAAIAIDNATLFEGLQVSNQNLTLAYDATIEGWSRALDLRDHETEGHSQRVTEMTLRLASRLGVRDETLVHLRRGALLHDIGKMGIPDGILLKPGPLTDDEWTVMRQHPAFAHDLLAPIHYLRQALDIPYAHHEKWDGSGYPRGLKGEAIPLAARIFAVVDVWDALRSDRPYRPAWAEADVRAYIQRLSGAHFDPTVARAFQALLEEEPD